MSSTYLPRIVPILYLPVGPVASFENDVGPQYDFNSSLHRLGRVRRARGSVPEHQRRTADGFHPVRLLRVVVRAEVEHGVAAVKGAVVDSRNDDAAAVAAT